MVTESAKPVANPTVVFREEFDDWAVLFDPETGSAFGMNPVSALIWKMLDGRHTVSDILIKVKDNCGQVPDDAPLHIQEFIDALHEKGLVGLEVRQG